LEDDTMSVTQSGVDSLFEQNAGRVFAYCYARVGSRNVAEWAVNATFDRARAALSNGGISEPELDWLLRTADKFCAPKLCLDARPLESMVVLQDWRGRSFDEIAKELEARYARLEEERSRLTPWRRLLSALNAGPAISWVKGLVGGLGAVKATAAGVALVGAVAIVGTPLGAKLHDVVRSDSTPSQPASSTPAGSGATPVAPSQQTGDATRRQPGPAGATVTQANGARAENGGKAGALHPAGATAQATASSPAGTSQAATGVSASSSVTTTPATGRQQPASKEPGAAVPGATATTSGQAVPTPSVTTPTLPAPPKTPTAPTATVPSVDTSAVPSVSTPTVETPTVDTPTVDTPGAPSTSTPNVDTPTVPNVDTPPTPTVSAPSVPNPPGNVTVPTVTLPKP
jgi:hypothetical protein